MLTEPVWVIEDVRAVAWRYSFGADDSEEFDRRGDAVRALAERHGLPAGVASFFVWPVHYRREAA